MHLTFAKLARAYGQMPHILNFMSAELASYHLLMHVDR
jgi:hypothetical protein